MSYILDAMRKSERDRTFGQIANMPPAGSDWRGRIVYSGLVLVIVALLAAGIWFMFNKPPLQPLPDTATVKAEPIPATESVEEKAPAKQPETPTITVTPGPSTDDKLWTTPTDISPSPRVTIAEPDDWRELPNTAQVAAQLPEGLVLLHIGIHVYDANVSKRMVVIDGWRYRQGDSLPEGAELVEITPDGMVLRYRGTWFHKRR